MIARLTCYDEPSHTAAASTPTFTAEQQTFINSIAADERRQAEAKFSKRNDLEKAQLQGQLEALLTDSDLNPTQKTSVQDLIADIKISRQKFNEVLSDLQKKHGAALKAEQDRAETSTKRYVEYRRDRDLIQVAAAVDAVDPSQIQQLLRDRVQYRAADKDPVTGKDRPERVIGVDKDGNEVALHDFVAGFAEQNPNLIKGKMRSGAGGFNAAAYGSTVVDPSKLSMAEYTKWRATPAGKAYTGKN